MPQKYTNTSKKQKKKQNRYKQQLNLGDRKLYFNLYIQVLDVATKEQAESQKKEVPNKEDENVDKPTESSDDLPAEEDIEKLETTESMVQDAEKTEVNKENQSKKKQHPQGKIIIS